jgi:hypothetical protein
MFSTLNVRAFLRALLATALALASVVLGSRNLRHFDGALVAYLFGTLFAVFGIVYRYSVWLQRVPTRLYWRRTLPLLFEAGIVRGLGVLGRSFVVNLLAQRFIFRRGRRRGVAHMLLAWGCLSAFAITLPLTFGWIHFTLVADGTYQAHLFGFPAFGFTLGSAVAHGLFHALNVSSLMVIVGAGYFLHRRTVDPGQIATQTFEIDWMPLLLLVLVSLTGLGITWDYELMQGKAHAFMAITHAITVVLFLVWLPFGKFFHIFQRAAQTGVALYRDAGERGPAQLCARTGDAFAPQLQVDDLKAVTTELGFDFQRSDGGSHLDLSPHGKRAAFAAAHLAARRRGGAFFG